MSGLGQRLGERLGQPDTVQVLLGYLALSTVIIALAWPSQPLDANDAWFSLVQAKSLFAAFVSLAYGMGYARRPKQESTLILLALFALFVLSLPLEAVAWMSSVPPLPLWWSPLVHSLVIPAYFALGLGLGQALARLGLLALAPVLALLLLVGAFFADLALGVVLFNPATAATNVSPLHLAFTTSLLALYLVMTLRKRHKP
ncbi:MAG: hypothetical protein M3498_10925 [Deinococcota bacterium]|nr:hypothetical protein [Deinococcota bacterium]